jgi:hypothetical protein
MFCDVNKLSDNFIFNNPFYTALLISIIIILIVIISFNNSKDTLFKKSFRTFIYIFCVTLGIVFLHNNQLMKELDEKLYVGSLEIAPVSGGVTVPPGSNSFSGGEITETIEAMV